MPDKKQSKAPIKPTTAQETKAGSRATRNHTVREAHIPLQYNPTYSTQPLTDVSSVNQDTPIETLNLNWRETDLPERVRTKHVHRLHPYLGKFIPQLVEIFLRKYFLPGQTVLDPFAGSGTTLVQANELRINSVGYDISEFNVLLARTKTMKYDVALAQKEALDILAKVRTITQREDVQLRLFKETRTRLYLSQADNEYLQKWFAPQALRELLTYRQLIQTEGYHYPDLLKIILCRSARSARLITHFDLDWPKAPQTTPYWCFKHSRECVPTAEAFKFLHRYTIDSIRRIKEYDELRSDAIVSINHADSRKAVIPPIDGVLTSPPYVGLIDYHEQHSYAYHLLGLDDNRKHEIGAAVDGAGERAKKQYVRDLVEVFKHAKDVMPIGGRMIVVAGDRANLYDGIASQVGVEVEAIVKRHVNRRTGIRSSEFFESVFIWRKTQE